jgi:hypothetical protein
MNAAPGATRTADFYVSPKGSDAWSGKLAVPNRSRSDGPFRTPAAALKAVARLRKSVGDQRSVTVLVRTGTYVLDAPLVITPDMSGTEAGPTVIAAYPGEKPIITGGVRLSGWKVADGRWTMQIPEVRDGKWYFEQLFVNDQRRYRPRLPKNGYYFIAAEAPPSPEAQGKGYDRFVFNGTDIRADWHNRSDVDVLCFQQWTMARLRIADVNAERHTVRFVRPTLGLVSYAALAAGQRYIVENVREALTEPGEWYLDRKSGELTYIPRGGERPDKADVWAPRLEHLVEFRGDMQTRRWVQHVSLNGLTFAHSNWITEEGGYQAAQAEWPIGGAIRAVGAHHCRLDGCTLKHVGGYAVDFGAACQHATIENCKIVDMGAGGVKLGETAGNSNAELLSGWHTVRNCLIAHGGRLHPAGIGVWIGASPHNLVEHNEICDLYYTGISVGWSWGYAPTDSHHNTLQYNHVHHIGQGVLSDMGATYTLGLAPGSVQRFNVFHDVESYSYGGWGIYFDEGTTGMLAENNLVYGCKSAGFHQHYGRDNMVRNNIFAMNRESQLMRTRAEDHLSFTFENNIVYWKTGALLASNWSGDNFKMNRNLYWKVGGQPFDFAGMSLEEWRAKGRDVDSIIADPLFVNPEKTDYHLLPSSPASKIGFVPFDYTKAGRVGIGLSKQEPVARPRAYPAPQAPQPPRSVAEDFEDYVVGSKVVGAFTYEDGDVAVVRVTDETAATGKHSLKFVDAAGQRVSYLPHIFYGLDLTDGIALGSFSIRVEKGAVVYHEWRDGGANYHVGPSLRIEADGSLHAGGRKLMDIPHGVWFQIEIVCPLGKAATGKWDLTVRLPGRTAPLRFEGLPCDRRCTSLQWYGFVADGDAPGVFYIDDIRLSPRNR